MAAWDVVLPLPSGEVELRSNSGEGLRSIEGLPHPALCADLSQWERWKNAAHVGGGCVQMMEGTFRLVGDG